MASQDWTLPASRQQAPEVGILKNKVASSQDWDSMVDHSLVNDEVFQKGNIELLFKHKDLWSRWLGAIKATQHTIDLKEGTRTIRQQTYHASQNSEEVLREHTESNWRLVL